MFPWHFTRDAMTPPGARVQHRTEGMAPRALQNMRRPQVAKMSMRQQSFGKLDLLVDMVLDFAYSAPIHVWGRGTVSAFPLRVAGSAKLPPGLCFCGGRLSAGRGIASADDANGAWAVTRDRHFAVILTGFPTLRVPGWKISKRLEVWCAASFIEIDGCGLRFRATPLLFMLYTHQKPRLGQQVYYWTRDAHWIEPCDSDVEYQEWLLGAPGPVYPPEEFEMTWTPGHNLMMHGFDTVVNNLMHESHVGSSRHRHSHPDGWNFEPATEGRIMDYVVVPRVCYSASDDQETSHSRAGPSFWC